MRDERSDFLFKAREALAGAESEFANQRYDNAANRAYYACFFAAIAALLMDAGIRPQGARWEHDFVAAQFAGLLIQRRKLYPDDLRDAMYRNMAVRQEADYAPSPVSKTKTERAIKRAVSFVVAVEMKVRART